MIKQIILFLILLTFPLSAQWNLFYDSDTTGQYDDSIFVDLGIDPLLIQAPYDGGQELRAIGIIKHGTWTNDSMQVYTAMHLDSTYLPLYYDGALVYEISTTTASQIAFKPWIYAGLRYIMFKLPADEAANRTYSIVRRQY